MKQASEAYLSSSMKAKDLMTKEVLTVDKDERLETVLDTMVKHRVSKVIVLEKGDIVGVITDGDIADELGASKNRGVPASHLHASSAMRKQFPSVAPDAELRSILEILMEDDTGIVPVVHDKACVGVITASDALSLVAVDRPLSELATTHLHVVSPDDRVIHARRVMLDNHVERVPVLERGKLVGIVGEMDIARGFARFKGTVADKHQSAAIQRFLVREIMQQTVITATPEMTARQAVLLMKKEDVGSLPVMRADRIVGIVTRTDLLRLLSRA